MPNRLVIAPHVDDDVIGCGGILDADTAVFYCGVEEFHVVDLLARLREAMDVAKVTGHQVFWPTLAGAWAFHSKTNFVDYPCLRKVNQYDFLSLKNDFEEVIEFVKPEEVLFPWPSYNQDHQTVYDAAMVATRPHDKNHFVKRILCYEEPDCFWPYKEPFQPQLYRPIDFAKKAQLYNLMKSQIRGHRSIDQLQALAIVRGAAANVPAAEAYRILRWVDA